MRVIKNHLNGGSERCQPKIKTKQTLRTGSSESHLCAPAPAVPRQPPLCHACGPRPGTYNALAAQEVGDDLFVDVVQQASGALVVIARVNEELPPGVVVDERADL